MVENKNKALIQNHHNYYCIGSIVLLYPNILVLMITQAASHVRSFVYALLPVIFLVYT